MEIVKIKIILSGKHEKRGESITESVAAVTDISDTVNTLVAQTNAKLS